jgi:phospho-N-acetylmuramoyl-pentapeptide-transferase
MLFYLLYQEPWLRTQLSVLNVVRYITVRTAVAAITALALSLVLGPWLIRKLREFQIGQIIRQDGPDSHRAKAGTPTMGGLLILTLRGADDVVGRFDERLRLDCGADDRRIQALVFRRLLKIVRRSHLAFGRYRVSRSCWLSWWWARCLPANHGLYSLKLVFPFFKNLIPNLGWWYLPFAVFVLVAESNAVNLTDGLDGLAISVFAIAAAAYTALTYVVGNRVLADYLLLIHFPPVAD